MNRNPFLGIRPWLKAKNAWNFYTYKINPKIHHQQETQNENSIRQKNESLTHIATIGTLRAYQ